MIYKDGYEELSALGNPHMWCLKKKSKGIESYSQKHQAEKLLMFFDRYDFTQTREHDPEESDSVCDLCGGESVHCLPALWSLDLL